MLFPFLSIDSSCEEALKLTGKQLSEASLRVVQTFDLHIARFAPYDCSCPNHGMEECDCQLVVLLIYGEALEPATLILHGNDGKTWFSMTEGPLHHVDKNLTLRIR